MPLDQVKTQVLILHSQQSTLDDLSACVDDRYTVHCATSGSEALNTLVETPIHVLITAQDLPGMSGIEALREARKRSPDTIGILLASDNDSNIEALVGVDEVFQIVRGGITRTDLNQLIGDAAQQVRLLTIAESANDTEIEPGESETEHIVMETADNGSTIISDGSGTWSAHKPDKSSADTANEADDVEILVVSKDEDFVATVQKSSLGVRNIRYANTPAEADEAFARFPIGVAVVDAAMVGSKVEDLTRHLRARNERLVCVVAGRRDDGEMLMDLINRGKVYRFLLKPVSPGRARLAIEASVKHHIEAPKTAFRMTGSHVAPLSALTPDDAAGQTVPSSTAAGHPATAAPESQVADEAGRAPANQPDAVLTAGSLARDDGQTGSFQAVDDESGQAALRASDARKASARIPVSLAVGVVIASAIIAVGILTFTDTDTPETQDPAALVPNTPAETGTRALSTAESVAASDGRIDALLAETETAVLERRLNDAAAAADEVRLIDPENARLPFLTAQIAEMRLRATIDDARAAIREARFADAASALRAASAFDPGESSEIEAVTEELLSAQSERRTEDLLERAAASIDQDKLLSPDNDNAFYYYQLVLKNEPEHTAANQGVKVIAGKLVLEARKLSDDGQFDSAGNLLVQARRLDPSSSAIDASIRALADARERAAAGQRRQEEARLEAMRAEAERLAALPKQSTATDVSAAAPAADENSADPAAITAADASPQEAAQDGSSADTQNITAEQDASDSTPTIAADAVPQEAPQAELSPDSPANEPGEGETLAGTGNAAPDSAESSQPAVEPTVPVSSLTQNKYVAPKYPRSARRRKQSGWVDIVFTVSADGTTRDIEIRDATPGEVFVDAAIRAVEKWEFEPVLANGEPVEKRAGVRMMFAIEQ